MTTLQTEYTEQELLATHDLAEPLVAGGVRCHGGFDDDGTYVSPRTKNRVPAIQAWQAERTEQFGTPLLDVDLDSWPSHYPNVAQAKYLIEEGVRQPLISTLTRIGTVEGFGAMIRYSNVPELQNCFTEDVAGTAMTHLTKGLYEAHARDEAGFEDEGGHKQMWSAARDVAFENPVTEDDTQTMLQRMGIGGGGGGAGAPSAANLANMRQLFLANRLFPDGVDPDLEVLIERMASLLLIEITAFHTFAWAEEILSDADLVAGDGEAARLVSYIRADETPHVEYLKTVLSEMRDRTFIGANGATHPGSELIGTLERALGNSRGARRADTIKLTLRELGHALEGNPRKGEILEQFNALGDVDLDAVLGSDRSAAGSVATY